MSLQYSMMSWYHQIIRYGYWWDLPFLSGTQHYNECNLYYGLIWKIYFSFLQAIVNWNWEDEILSPFGHSSKLIQISPKISHAGCTTWSIKDHFLLIPFKTKLYRYIMLIRTKRTGLAVRWFRISWLWSGIHFSSWSFLSTPVLMHGGLFCIAFCPSVCHSAKTQMTRK